VTPLNPDDHGRVPFDCFVFGARLGEDRKI